MNRMFLFDINLVVNKLNNGVFIFRVCGDDPSLTTLVFWATQTYITFTIMSHSTTSHHAPWFYHAFAFVVCLVINMIHWVTKLLLEEDVLLNCLSSWLHQTPTKNQEKIKKNMADKLWYMYTTSTSRLKEKKSHPFFLLVVQ